VLAFCVPAGAVAGANAAAGADAAAGANAAAGADAAAGANAAAGADGALEGAAVQEAPDPVTARQPKARDAKAVKISLADAAVTAEKIYYCGELYIFADSMIKTNFEMAAIAENIKDATQSNTLLRNRAGINSMNKKYNAICEIYNSWIDVKGDLEFFIDTVGSRNVYTKAQLQIAFNRTLATINETKAMLEAANEYYEEQTAENRRTLTGHVDKTTAAASSAAKAAAPLAQSALNGYRAFFDLFAQQAGLELEYKTWSNPELDIQP